MAAGSWWYTNLEQVNAKRDQFGSGFNTHSLFEAGDL